MISLNESITNGAISADWTLTIAFGIIGFLLVAIASMVAKHYISTLNKIEKAIERLTDRLDKVEDKQIEFEIRLEGKRQ